MEDIRDRVGTFAIGLTLLASALLTVGVGEAAVGDVLKNVPIPATCQPSNTCLVKAFFQNALPSGTS